MINPKILSHDKLQEISLAWSEEDKLKHPHDNLGRFAKKASSQARQQKGVGAQYKHGRQRFTIERGETEEEAYKKTLQQKKDKNLQRKLNRIARQEAARSGFGEWKRQLREQQNADLIAKAREGEASLGDLEKYTIAPDESQKHDLAGDVVKEIGILSAIQSGRNVGKKIFQKLGYKVKPAAKSSTTKTPSIGTKSNPIPAEVVEHYPGQYSAFKKSPSAAKAAADQYSAFRKDAFKDVAKTAGGALATQAAIETGGRLVGASRFAAISKPFAGVTGAAVRVGGVLLNPWIGIPLTIAGASAYFHHKKKKRDALIQHERELMRRDADYASGRMMQYKTAQEIHREAVAYATKRYAQAEVEAKKQAIDEELNSRRVRSKMQKSARITARSATSGYAQNERQNAVAFSYVESKHPRDEKGRWTASPESNAQLIKKSVKKFPLKAHIAGGAAVGAAIGTIKLPVIGTAIGAAAGGSLAATRKFTLKKSFERINHRALQEGMLKEIVGGGDSYARELLKSKNKDEHENVLKTAAFILNHPDPEIYDEKYLKEAKNKFKTYVGFHRATHKEKQKAMETNTLHELTKKYSKDIAGFLID